MSLLEQIQQHTGLGLTSLDLQRTLSRRLQAVTTTLIINVRNINLLEIHFIIHSFTIKASILSSVCRKLSLRARLHFAKALMVASSSNGRAIIFLNASTLGQCYRYACLGFYVYNPLIVVGQVKTLTNSNCLSHFVRLPKYLGKVSIFAQGIFEACGREHYGPPKYLGKVSIFVSGSALGICLCSFFNHARWFFLLFQNYNACVILHGCIGIRHVSALVDLNSMATRTLAK